jgi:hypothetical protein
MTSGIIALIVCFAAGTGFASGFPAADAERRSFGGIVGELLADENCDRGHRQFAG